MLYNLHTYFLAQKSKLPCDFPDISTHSVTHGSFCFLFINHVKLNSLSSMTVRNDIEFIMFLAEIGAQERKEHYREQYFGAPDGLAAEIAAEKS